MAIASEHDQSPEAQAVLSLVRERKELSERARKPYMDRFREWAGLHRNVSRYRTAFQNAREPDRDEVREEARREFGAELFIPMIFTTVESVVPRALANDPQMKTRPRNPDLSTVKAEAVARMFENRQQEIGYSLRLQPVVRQGFKYGIGVQKTMAERRTRQRMSMEPGIYGQRSPHMVDDEQRGPITEFVDVTTSFLWDPLASDMETSRYAIHRTWLDYQAIVERVQSGAWPVELDLEAIKGMGTGTGEHQAMLTEWADAKGLTNFDFNLGNLHEVLEYHDGTNVYTVLDGALVVQMAENPFLHRELPFQIFRPTLDEGNFIGIGEIEPIVDLQYELNTLRSQRRDNATLVLQKAFVYAEGMVDPNDLVIGPGTGIGVFGNPSDVIQPLTFADIPASGYQEEAAIKDDMNLASGISESTAGVDQPGEQTATGIQLVQAAANIRIANKTKMLMWETITPAASQWLEIFREQLAEKPLEFPVETPEGFQFVTVTAEDLDLVAAVIPEAGSTEPENKPQKKNDAMALFNQTNGNPAFDPRAMAKWLLQECDVHDPEAKLAPMQQTMNPEVAEQVGQSLVQSLQEAGMDPEQAEDVVLEAMQAAMQTTGVTPPPEGVAPTNGAAAPQEAPA